MENIKNKFTIGHIYRWLNKINGKIYIGQTTRINVRPYTHFRKTNPKFKAAIDKYGKENFELKILCECYSQEDLNWAEKFFIIEWYDSIHRSRGYNLWVQDFKHHLQTKTKEEYNAFCRKMKRVQNNPETKIKKRDSLLIAMNTESYKEKRKQLLTPENKLKYSRIQIESRKNPKVIKNLSEGQKRRHQDPEKHKAFLLSLEPARKNPEVQRKIGQSLKKYISENKETWLKSHGKKWKKNLSIAQNKRYAIKENREKHKLSHRTDQCRMKVSEAQKSNFRKSIEKDFDNFTSIHKEFTMKDVHIFYIKDRLPSNQEKCIIENMFREFKKINKIEKIGMKNYGKGITFAKFKKAS